MALINRFARLFTADMHAVMDRMEEPEILLKQALRDMEAAVAAGEQRVRQLGRQHRELDAALERAADSLAELASELDVCLGAGNDDLARRVIRRRLQTERQRSVLEDERSRLTRQLQEQERLLAEQREALAELTQKADAFQVAESGAAGEAIRIDVTDADVEVALLTEKQRRAGR